MIWQNFEKNGLLERMQIIPGEMQEIIQGAWIEIAIPTPTEVEWMVANLNLPPEFIKSVLDEEESSHVDTADDAKLIVIDVPMLDPVKNSKNAYTTMPFSIIHTLVSKVNAI